VDDGDRFVVTSFWSVGLGIKFRRWRADRGRKTSEVGILG